MIKIEKLKEKDIEEYISIGKYANSDIEVWEKLLRQDIETKYKLNDINTWEFYVFILDNRIIWTALLISRKHDLHWIDIFNIAVKDSMQWKWYWKEIMNHIFKKIPDYNKEYAFVATWEKMAWFYIKSWMSEYGKINLGLRNRIYLYKKL